MNSFSKKEDKTGKKLNPEKALQLLKKNGCDKKTIEHCKAVSRQAVKIARKIKKRGRKVDVDFVEVAGLLHDIGRGVTHGIGHGVEGARLLNDYPRYAKVCERHIGGGIDKKEAGKLGLPARDFVPKTLEEKIIAHADNVLEGCRVVPLEEAVSEFEWKLGGKHPAALRVAQLGNYVEKLMEG